MQILYILAVVSFAVLLIAAIAITRHIRRSASMAATDAPDFAPSIPRSPTIDQQLAHRSRPTVERVDPTSHSAIP